MLGQSRRRTINAMGPSGLEANGGRFRTKRVAVKESENRELGLNHVVKPSGPREYAVWNKSNR